MSEITITEKEVDELILSLLKKHSEFVELDINEFQDLLKHSLSLSTLEKKRVVDAVPTLSQFQFDELKKVFIDERVKFKELASKHPDDIKKLLSKQQKEWMELWDLYKSSIEAEKKKSQDDSKIDDIKSSLWL